jgi:hypothetical protein
MAIINLKDVKVKRVFYNGLGAEFVESFQTRDGETAEKKYSAFFDAPHGLSEGDVGNVSGLLSVKARLWERDGEPPVPVADIVLNSPRFEASAAGEDTPF